MISGCFLVRFEPKNTRVMPYGLSVERLNMATTHMMRQLFPPIAGLRHARRDGANMGKHRKRIISVRQNSKLLSVCLLIRICVFAGGHIVHLFFSQHRAVGIHYLNGPLAGPGGQHVFT